MSHTADANRLEGLEPVPAHVVAAVASVVPGNVSGARRVFARILTAKGVEPKTGGRITAQQEGEARNRLRARPTEVDVATPIRAVRVVTVQWLNDVGLELLIEDDSERQLAEATIAAFRSLMVMFIASMPEDKDREMLELYSRRFENMVAVAVDPTAAVKGLLVDEDAVFRGYVELAIREAKEDIATARKYASAGSLVQKTA